MNTEYPALSFFQKRADNHPDGFHKFSDNGAYYFSYNRNGEVLLISPKYFNIIKSEEALLLVKELMQEQDRFKGVVNASGQPYLSLRNHRNKEVAVSRAFNSQDEMDDALDILLTSSFSRPASLAEAYLPTPAYIGQEGFHKFRHKNGLFYFSYNDKYGKPFLISQGFPSQTNRDSEVGNVARLAQDESKWFRGESNDGKDFFFCLRAEGEHELARSPIHASEKEMMTSFDWVRGNESRIGNGSAMLGGVFVSAAMISEQLKTAKGSSSNPATGSSASIAANTTGGSSKGIVKKEVSTFNSAELSDVERNKLVAEREQLREQRVQEEMRLMEKRREEEAIRKRRKLEEEEIKIIREKRESAERERASRESERRAALAKKTVVTAEEVKPKSYIPAAKVGTPVPETVSSLPWWPVLAALVVLPLLFWWNGCSDSLIPPPAPPNDMAQAVPVLPPDPPAQAVDIVTQKEDENLAAPVNDLDRCVLDDLGFLPGTIESALANCINNPDCKLPAKFQWYDTGFHKGSAHMSPDAYPSVKNLSELLKACDNISIDIYGHISSDENDVYIGKYQDDTNISLSGIRARCTFRKLQRAGVDTDRMTFIGKGKTDPLIKDDTERAYERNRRTEIVLKLQ